MNKTILIYLVARGFIGEDYVVVDAGCGDGVGTAILSLTARKVIGIDRDKKMIAKAMKEYKAENNYFVLGNLDQTTVFPQCDMVVAMNLLPFLRYPKNFISNAQSSTKHVILLSYPIAEAQMYKDMAVNEEWEDKGDIIIEDEMLSVFGRKP